jgi:hypothetical protein
MGPEDCWILPPFPQSIHSPLTPAWSLPIGPAQSLYLTTPWLAHPFRLPLLPVYIMPLTTRIVTSALKMEAIRFCETLVATNQSTRRLNPRERHYLQCRGNLKSHSVSPGWRKILFPQLLVLKATFEYLSAKNIRCQVSVNDTYYSTRWWCDSLYLRKSRVRNTFLFVICHCASGVRWWPRQAAACLKYYDCENT